MSCPSAVSEGHFAIQIQELTCLVDVKFNWQFSGRDNFYKWKFCILLSEDFFMHNLQLISYVINMVMPHGIVGQCNSPAS